MQDLKDKKKFVQTEEGLLFDKTVVKALNVQLSFNSMLDGRIFEWGLKGAFRLNASFSLNWKMASLGWSPSYIKCLWISG